MRYQAEDLTIESLPARDKLVVRWLGRSDARDPGEMLSPVLDAVRAEMKSASAVEFDFRSLEYMNSSTIRPILAFIQAASGSVASVRLLYDKTKTWQRLAFSAMGVALSGLDNVELCA